MSRRLILIPLLLILMCFIALFIGWYSLPNWLPQTLNSQLAEYNAQASHWRFERPNLTERRIDQIHISQKRRLSLRYNEYYWKGRSARRQKIS